MATVSEAFGMALDHFTGGRLGEAEVLLTRILDAVPDHADAAHIYGLVLAQTGRVGLALPHLAAAAQARDTADHYANYGLALVLAGRSEEAMAAFGRARTLDPTHQAAGRGLAELLAARGRDRCLAGDDRSAVADLRDALGLNPLHVQAALWLGTALHDTGDAAAAARAYRLGVVLDPCLTGAWANLATLAGKASASFWRRAIASRLPEADAGDWRALAEALAVADPVAAVAALRRAAGLTPASVRVWEQLGALTRSGPAAGAYFLRAVVLEPENPRPHVGLSNIAREDGLSETALREARKAVHFAPHLPEARLAHGLAALTLGQLAEGWADYDARWQAAEDRTTDERPQFDAPRWNGEDLAGPLLVWAEQGVGDEIMFASLLPELLARGVALIVWADARLHPLLARALLTGEMPQLTLLRRPGDDPRGVMAAAEAAMGDLPRFLRGDLNDFPAAPKPWLRADPDRTALLRRQWAPDDTVLLVGVSWRSGNSRWGAKRSVDPVRLAVALTAAAGDGRRVRLVNLQYGDVTADAAALHAAGHELLVGHGVDTKGDLDGLAALIAAVDLVVTIDNATAHLAGALGGPCWTLLPAAADWRWLADRVVSPWYPGMRLFRQNRADFCAGDWGGVLAAVRDALTAVLSGDDEALRPPPVAAAAADDDAAVLAREKDKYRQMWRYDDYRTISPGALQAEHFDLPGLLRRFGARTVLDAGCGSGKTSKHVMEKCGDDCRVYGFDIADNCLDPSFDAIKDGYLTVGCLWRREDFRDVYDGVICTDVLEHIPPHHVPAVLANLCAVCRKIAFLGIALYDDHFGPAKLGEPLHLTVKPPDWWLEKVVAAGFEVLRVDVLVHPTVGPAWLLVEAVPRG